MSRKFLKKYLPDSRHVREHRSLKVFGEILNQPSLWLLNRRSVPRAFAIGLFCAFLPIPAQMVAAAAIAIPLSANLPLSVALVWVTNPVTMPPIFWFAYEVGRWILGSPPVVFEVEWSLAWFMEELYIIGGPLLLGSVICGAIAAALGYIGMTLYWRWYVLRIWRTRHRPKVEKVLHLPPPPD